MAVQKISEKVFEIGCKHPDRKLFDEIIPLPNGTTYNSYLIIGSEKTALIDTVDPAKTKEFIENIEKSGIKKIDFVVSNHAEQDHSGSISAVLEKFPEAKVVANSKCKSMLIDLLHVPEEKFLEISDRQTISLGDKTLQFFLAPWVHWPETMFTLLQEDKILFTCDFLGSHLSQEKLAAENNETTYDSAKRYFAEIMMPYKVFFKKNLELAESLHPEIICPSHGPVLMQPDFVVKWHKEWLSEIPKNEVLIVFVSMHGSTAKMADFLENALEKKGISVKKFNLIESDFGKIANALVDCATIIIGTPTFLGQSHPTALYAAYISNSLKPKAKFASIIGSYGWGGNTVEQLKALISNPKIEFLEPVLAKGLPSEKDFEALEKLSETIAQKHKESGLF